MGFSLDPAVNPLLRLYALVEESTLLFEDGRLFLELPGAPLSVLGEETARPLIDFLHRDCLNELDACGLWLNELRVLDFAASSVTDWFDFESIDALVAAGSMSPATHEAFAAYRAAVEHGYFPHDIDPVATVLQLLGPLCDADAGEFELRLSLDKQRAVAAHLTPPAHLEEDGEAQTSIHVWFDKATWTRAIGGFAGLKEWFRRASRRPMVLLFYRTSADFDGDFLRVHSLSARSGEDLEQKLRQTGPQLLTAYDELLQRHRLEPRPEMGGLFRMPPALLLQQDGRLSGYPKHPLFVNGPLRPLLVFTLLAWLAERLEERDGACRFIFVAGDEERQLDIGFSLDDVTDDGGSLFAEHETAEARLQLHRRLAALAADIQRCAGRRTLRQLWAVAVEQELSGPQQPGRLWTVLARIHDRFLEHELQVGGILPRAAEPPAAATAAPPTATVAESPPTPTQRQPAPPSPAAPFPYPDLELAVDIVDPAGSPRLRFELHGPNLGYLRRQVGELPLNRLDDDSFKELSDKAKDKLSALLAVQQAPEEPWLPAVDTLETWGKNLWKHEIPAELKREYARLREREERLNLLVISRDASFPWELAKPYQRDRPHEPRYEDPCWAMRFNLGRWLAGYTPPESELRFRQVMCVITPDLAGAYEERNYFRKLGERPGVEIVFPSTFDEIKQRLASEPFDVIHFACHGKFDKQQPREAAVRLPDGYELKVSELSDADIESNIAASRPLVFLNACHTGRVESTWTHLGGWAHYFIDSCCGAFLGCGWEVADPLAARFAAVFYDRLLGIGEEGEAQQPVSIGDAVLAAREAIRSSHNSTWLAYYLFGNPGCRIV